MRIEFRFRALESSNRLRDYAVRRIHFQLSRFGPEISSVVVRLGDVNGPKGGIDKQCQLTVRGKRVSTVVVENVSADVYAAVDLSVERAGRAVGRALERARGFKRIVSKGNLANAV